MQPSFGGIGEGHAGRAILSGQGALTVGHSYPDSPPIQKHLERCPAANNRQRPGVSGIPDPVGATGLCLVIQPHGRSLCAWQSHGGLLRKGYKAQRQGLMIPTSL